MRIAAFVGFLAVVLFASFGSAAGQAAAESAISHALSSSAGNGIGKAMGNITNQAATKVGQQAANAASRPSPAVTPPGLAKPSSKTAPVPAPTDETTSSLIVSIQGGARGTVTCKAGPSSGTARENAALHSSGTQKTCVESKDVSGDSHPAVVNLPAAK